VISYDHHVASSQLLAVVPAAPRLFGNPAHKKARSAGTVLSAIIFLVNRWIRRQVKELHAIGRVFR